MALTYEEIGRRIRQAREEQGLLQADLGRRMSRPRSHAAVSDIERGKTKPNVEELAEIARLLDKPLTYFLDTSPAESVVYRRSDPSMTREQRGETARSIDAFKEYARELARRQEKGRDR
ncbi:MAG: helix-turn-helix domain-containing protein [Thermomicrobiales bacterium]